MDQNKLKKKFVKGDRKAFDTIYEMYADAMYSVCLRYTRNVDEAADMLQDGFIKIYQNRGKFNTEQEFGPWIKRIIINEAINHYRANKKFDLVEEDSFFEEVEEPFELEESSNLKDILLEIIRELPEGYRAVFNMFVFDNLTHNEIADYLNVSVNTSKTQLSKARKMIKTKLAEKGITTSLVKA